MRLTDRYREELASPTGPLIERRAGDRDDHGPNVVYIYGGSLRGRVLLPYGDADNCLRCANVQLDAPDSAMRRGNFTVPNVHSAFKSNFSYKLRPFQRGGIQNENAMRKIIWTGLAALTIAVPTSAMAQHHDGGYRGGYGRSEEHTSELQSLMRISYAVFCLKKKTLHSS